MSRSKDAICKIIKYNHGYNRLNNRHKTITFLMFYEENMKIKAVTLIRINLKTGTVTASGCIAMGKKSIFPGTSVKQNCNDPVFVEKLSVNFLQSYRRNKEIINARRRELYRTSRIIEGKHKELKQCQTKMSQNLNILSKKE